MPTKTTKTSKKTAAKKPTKKVVKPVVAPKPVTTEIPIPDPYCHCTKRKRNMILTCVFVTSFVFGILFGNAFFCGCAHHKHMPRPHFVNGCLDVTSVKCPKMLEQLPIMDTDHNGCVTRAELRAAKRAMRHNAEPAPVIEQNAITEEAPVME